MTIQLQMIGTGDAFSNNYHNNNGLLLDGNFSLLIDCGATAPLAMHQLGRSFREVNATLITHIHNDHVGGLEELAIELMQDNNRKMQLLLPETLLKPLWDHIRKSARSKEARADSLEEMFNVTTLRPGESYTLSPEITLQLIRTPHIRGRDSYSLLLNNDIFYSADMTFQPELLIKLVRKHGVRKIFHDCELSGSGQVHTTLRELMSLPDDVRKLIYLMHYSDRKPEFEGMTGDMEFLVQHEIYEL
ncbi:MBL fold metallo-hydrolase [Paenibacillus sp. FSL L8-0340]|uniref:MBL fold metallo-hydrolase n=1 Tax=Paenibacillus sp. FSL L8-0340 TaxID=2954685 RepID=UPI003158C9E4